MAPRWPLKTPFAFDIALTLALHLVLNRIVGKGGKNRFLCDCAIVETSIAARWAPNPLLPMPKSSIPVHQLIQAERGLENIGRNKQNQIQKKTMCARPQVHTTYI